MKRLLLSAAAATSFALGGCATNAAQDHVIAGAATGAVVGGLAGATAGSVLPGIGTAAGAAVGGVLGAAVGAIINDRQYYRDTRGYCYYIDQYGQPRYEYNVRC